MDTVNKIVSQTTKPLENVFKSTVEPALNQPAIALLVSWLVVVSIVYSMEDLPSNVRDIVKHPASRTIITFLGVYMGTKDFGMSIIVTLGLLLAVYSFKIYHEGFDLIFPETDTMPGCAKVTVKDLEALFNGDMEQLKHTMYVSGVPLDVSLTDANAPLIATYLVNFGHSVSDSCSAPK